MSDNVPLTEDPSCASPDRVKGSGFARMAADEFACPPKVAAAAAPRYLEAKSGQSTFSDAAAADDADADDDDATAADAAVAAAADDDDEDNATAAAADNDDATAAAAADDDDDDDTAAAAADDDDDDIESVVKTLKLFQVLMSVSF